MAAAADRKKPKGEVVVGAKVEVIGENGIVRFIGRTKFGEGTWVGVELDTTEKGKNDGSIAGVRYFSPSKPGLCGVFVRPEMVKLRKRKKTDAKDEGETDSTPPPLTIRTSTPASDRASASPRGVGSPKTPSSPAPGSPSRHIIASEKTQEYLKVFSAAMSTVQSLFVTAARRIKEAKGSLEQIHEAIDMATRAYNNTLPQWGRLQGLMRDPMHAYEVEEVTESLKYTYLMQYKKDVDNLLAEPDSEELAQLLALSMTSMNNQIGTATECFPPLFKLDQMPDSDEEEIRELEDKLLELEGPGARLENSARY